MTAEEKALIECAAHKAMSQKLPVYMRWYTDGREDVPHWGESGASTPFNPLQNGSHLLPIIEANPHIAPQWEPRFCTWLAGRQTPAQAGNQSFALAALRCYVFEGL